MVTYVFTGTDIYQQYLVKALAKHFGARLLTIDSSMLFGVSFLAIIPFFSFMLAKNFFYELFICILIGIIVVISFCCTCVIQPMLVFLLAGLFEQKNCKHLFWYGMNLSNKDSEHYFSYFRGRLPRNQIHTKRVRTYIIHCCLVLSFNSQP